jgi:hypothetical protein
LTTGHINTARYETGDCKDQTGVFRSLGGGMMSGHPFHTA